jgi:uncharacterized protein YegL
MRVRAVAFGDEAVWHVAEATPVSELRWPPLQAAGRTRMGRALEVVAEAMTHLERRALRPAVILITDGRPTDDFDRGLAALLATPAGRSALRLAVAIGRDAELEPLERFIGDPSVPVLVADSAEEIADRLIAASIAVSRLSEVHVGGGHDANAKGVLLPRPPGPNLDDERIV